MRFLKNGIRSRCPSKRLALLVVGVDEMIDAFNELLDARERATANGLVSDQCEETFHLIEPGAVGRREVHMPTRASRQPRLDLRVAMSGVVVDDAMDVQIRRHRL